MQNPRRYRSEGGNLDRFRWQPSNGLGGNLHRNTQGGNDILYHASRHMSRTVDENRYRVPDIIEQNMRSGRNGIREGIGFYDYRDRDIDAYRRDRLTRFLELIDFMELLPAGLGRSH